LDRRGLLPLGLKTDDVMPRRLVGGGTVVGCLLAIRTGEALGEIDQMLAGVYLDRKLFLASLAAQTPEAAVGHAKIYDETASLPSGFVLKPPFSYVCRMDRKRSAQLRPSMSLPIVREIRKKPGFPLSRE
jgi:hypothetical protein